MQELHQPRQLVEVLRIESNRLALLCQVFGHFEDCISGDVGVFLTALDRIGLIAAPDTSVDSLNLLIPLVLNPDAINGLSDTLGSLCRLTDASCFEEHEEHLAASFWANTRWHKDLTSFPRFGYASSRAVFD